ncbi:MULTISPECIES: (d)CMP kinase [Myroides]|uniref:Cytidylate kinase n=1 Tax=Myroides odoratus TaxID=256 RepID=A0A378U413_MYROD|nr:(d)CMP kinase [Myroides odoratus]MDH6601564.1 cytidylate kinase [Myroides gitamensis]EHQ43281.1 cytidylate kinase [Myroides odoratus DSM 2801]EKB06666.1 cytidylate kinase [Myroides odoratus CIP 103059]MCS4237694.1 cytidylate kinase [Myroides odoratus]MDR0224750.1 (d)CMP kinase [Myroides odoratus]
MKKITIAIDGFSSTGKSTLAKALAKSLGYIYIDTGAMYRAVTLFAMRKGLISSKSFDEERLIELLDTFDVHFEYNVSKGYADIYLNDENVEELIRTLEVSRFVSQIAAVSAVRKKLVEQQQILGKAKGVVMDGRDIGTVVFPDAELKIFMTATPEIRAERRFKELQEKNSTVVYEEVFRNVVERDQIDTSRKDSPLVKAEDAVEIDNSNLSREEQFDLILQLVKERI